MVLGGTKGVGIGIQTRTVIGTMTQQQPGGWKMLGGVPSGAPGGAIDWQTAATGAWIPIQV